MFYRRFKVSGQFTDVVRTSEDALFGGTAAEYQCADVAALFNVPVASVTVDDTDGDPWDGQSQLLTAPVPPPPDPAEALVKAEEERLAALALLHKGVITKQQYEKVTGKPYIYGVNYPAPF
jgi:hypothetical protein